MVKYFLYVVLSPYNPRYGDLTWIFVKKKYDEVARSAGNYPTVHRLIEKIGFRRVVIAVLRGTTSFTQPPREPDTINPEA